MSICPAGSSWNHGSHRRYLPPPALQMTRIRGVNLSGWFILEPWVTPSLFAATGASNDGELQQVLGAVAYNERVREHYETFISEADFKRMSAMGLNAVRIPLPWHVFGSQTDRESYISCIDYIDRALEWAEKYEMRRDARPARFGDRSRWPGRCEWVLRDPRYRRRLAFVCERPRRRARDARAFGGALWRAGWLARYRVARLARDERPQKPVHCDRGHSQPLPTQFLSRCV